ncbi:MAG: B12-binding domain-containing radical SAM protein [Deltaproteobacteria bacterium]|nr:B12-binding domain-containing radical SAM protein [Deltaproteobacteria bacterium]
MLRIILIYAPPWKITPAGEAPYEKTEGPPSEGPCEQLLRGDSEHIPLGLLSLAAQARSAGHDVRVLNLFAFAWKDIEDIITATAADLYGLSCFTLNRRGTVMLAELIRRLHPQAHIAVGGPHASVLPGEMLAHCSAIDTVVIGEGEQTFMELVSRLKSGNDVSAIPGTAFRTPQGHCIAEPRRLIDDLDRLVPPTRYFDDHIVLSARGCAWDCSFCASRSLWGRSIRTHSADYVLDMLAELVQSRGLSALAFKDETFTADRTRTLALCRGMRERGLNIAWSCDTRADVLDAELLHAMRSAGCRRISLGVESADEEILRKLNKKISPAQVQAATRLARSVGLSVRYYMIAGSPGETMASVQRSLDFVRAAGPNEVIFNPFTLLPGTRDWERALRDGGADSTWFFADTFLELQPLTRDNKPESAELRAWLQANSGLRQVRPFSADECRTFVRMFPGLASAHLDLAEALLREDTAETAAQAARQALDAGHPQPGLCRNLLACCALRQCRLQEALELLLAAAESGCHQVVNRNIEAAQQWAALGGPASGRILDLASDTSFEISRPRCQPVGPGKLKINGRTYAPVF